MSVCPLCQWSDGSHNSSCAIMRAKRERDEFRRKYHEAMEILSRWENIDAAEATARLISAENDRIAEIRSAFDGHFVGDGACDGACEVVGHEWVQDLLAALARRQEKQRDVSKELS